MVRWSRLQVAETALFILLQRLLLMGGNVSLEFLGEAARLEGTKVEEEVMELVRKGIGETRSERVGREVWLSVVSLIAVVVVVVLFVTGVDSVA